MVEEPRKKRSWSTPDDSCRMVLNEHSDASCDSFDKSFQCLDRPRRAHSMGNLTHDGCNNEPEFQSRAHSKSCGSKGVKLMMTDRVMMMKIVDRCEQARDDAGMMYDMIVVVMVSCKSTMT